MNKNYHLQLTLVNGNTVSMLDWFKQQKIKTDLVQLVNDLQSNPELGTHLFNSCYKIRLANSSVPTGKSKGFRIITYYIDNLNNLYLLSMYSKSDKDTISDSEIIELLKQIN